MNDRLINSLSRAYYGAYGKFKLGRAIGRALGITDGTLDLADKYGGYFDADRNGWVLSADAISRVVGAAA